MIDFKDKKNKIQYDKIKTFGIVDNTFVKSVKNNDADRIEIEIGDSKEPLEFKPQIKIKRWDNEVNFSMRADEHDDAIIETDGELIKYITPEYEVHQYEKPEVSEDGGYEFEWVLPKKPNSNILTASIRTKDLDFFYQPELTEEEIAEGHIRPENVVGSYAVYHKTKRDNCVGGKEYKTGKAFHIFRPEAIDSEGNKTWCELNVDIDTEKLTVTVPQEFLDNAVYPIVVDPTFGYTSGGASAAFMSANYAYGSHYNAAYVNHPGVVYSFHAYTKYIGTQGSIKMCIWNDTLNTDVTEVSSEYLVDNTTVDWITILSTENTQFLRSGHYVGIMTGVSNRVIRQYDVVSLIGALDSTNNYTTPNNFGNTSSTNTTSAYITYYANDNIVPYQGDIVIADNPNTTTEVFPVPYMGDIVMAIDDQQEASGDVSISDTVTALTITNADVTVSTTASTTISDTVTGLTISNPDVSVTTALDVTVNDTVTTLTINNPDVTVITTSSTTINDTANELTINNPDVTISTSENTTINDVVTTLTTGNPEVIVTTTQNITIDDIVSGLELFNPDVTISTAGNITIDDVVTGLELSNPDITVSTTESATINDTASELTLNNPDVTISTTQNTTINDNATELTLGNPDVIITTAGALVVNDSTTLLNINNPDVTISTVRNVQINDTTTELTVNNPDVTISTAGNTIINDAITALTIGNPDVTIQTGGNVTIDDVVTDLIVGNPEVTITTIRNITIDDSITGMTVENPSVTILLTSGGKWYTKITQNWYTQEENV